MAAEHDGRGSAEQAHQEFDRSAAAECTRDAYDKKPAATKLDGAETVAGPEGEVAASAPAEAREKGSARDTKPCSGKVEGADAEPHRSLTGSSAARDAEDAAARGPVATFPAPTPPPQPFSSSSSSSSSPSTGSDGSAGESPVLPPSQLLNRDLLQVVAEWLDSVNDILALRASCVDWAMAITHLVAHGNRKCYGAFDASSCTLISATTRISERNALTRLGVAALPDLTAITLQVFKLPQGAFETLGAIRPGIRHIAITRCRGRDSLATLTSLSWLRSVKLHNAPEVTSKQLYAIFGGLPALVEFDGCNLPAVTGTFADFVAAAPQCLRNLRLALVPEVTGSPLQPLAKLPLLKGLSLSGFPKHSTEELLPLAGSFHLQSLQLDSLLVNLPREPAALGQLHGLLRLSIMGSTVTDYTVQVLATLPRLESLCLYQAGRLGEPGFDAMASMSRLEFLLLGDCSSDTAGGLDTVCRCLSQVAPLKHLVFHNCCPLPDAALHALSGGGSLLLLRGLDVQTAGQVLSADALRDFLARQRELKTVCGTFSPEGADIVAERGVRVVPQLHDIQDPFREAGRSRCPLPCCSREQRP